MVDCVPRPGFTLPAKERDGRPDEAATAPRLGKSGVLHGIYVLLAFRFSAFDEYSVKTVRWA